MFQFICLTFFKTYSDIHFIIVISLNKSHDIIGNTTIMFVFNNYYFYILYAYYFTKLSVYIDLYLLFYFFFFTLQLI